MSPKPYRIKFTLLWMAFVVSVFHTSFLHEAVTHLIKYFRGTAFGILFLRIACRVRCYWRSRICYLKWFPECFEVWCNWGYVIFAHALYLKHEITFLPNCAQGLSAARNDLRIAEFLFQVQGLNVRDSSYFRLRETHWYAQWARAFSCKIHVMPEGICWIIMQNWFPF